MLMYSVLVHVGIATLFLLFKVLNLSFSKTLPPVTYTVNLIEFEKGQPKKKPGVAKQIEKKAEPKPAPKPKEEPKPEAKVEPKPEPKPQPKTEAKKKVVLPPEKMVETPNVVKQAVPKQKPAEVKAAPEPPKEQAPPPPQLESVEVARIAEPEPPPVAESTVDLDTDNITPELKWYIEIIRRKVWQNWIEPAHALPLGAHARVVIRFEIGRDGTFASDPVIFESSSIFLLDQSGYRAVFRSVPFPPLPEGYAGTSLGVRFGFEYGERA
jgi:outer membrane biosynthesis protein TonB